jgi:hypothetical protein
VDVEVVENIESEDSLRVLDGCREQTRTNKLYMILHGWITALTVEYPRRVNAVSVHEHCLPPNRSGRIRASFSPGMTQMHFVLPLDELGSHKGRTIPSFDVVESVMWMHFDQALSADHVAPPAFWTPKERQVPTRTFNGHICDHLSVGFGHEDGLFNVLQLVSEDLHCRRHALASMVRKITLHNARLTCLRFADGSSTSSSSSSSGGAVGRTTGVRVTLGFLGGRVWGITAFFTRPDLMLNEAVTSTSSSASFSESIWPEKPRFLP